MTDRYIEGEFGGLVQAEYGPWVLSHDYGVLEDRVRELEAEIRRLQRLCKKQEATIQRYEDALMDGGEDEWEPQSEE